MYKCDLKLGCTDPYIKILDNVLTPKYCKSSAQGYDTKLKQDITHRFLLDYIRVTVVL